MRQDRRATGAFPSTGFASLLLALLTFGWSAVVRADAAPDERPAKGAAPSNALQRLVLKPATAKRLVMAGPHDGQFAWQRDLALCNDADCARALPLPPEAIALTIDAVMPDTAPQMRAVLFDTVTGHFFVSARDITDPDTGVEVAGNAVVEELANDLLKIDAASAPAPAQATPPEMAPAQPAPSVAAPVPDAALTPVESAPRSFWQRIPVWSRAMGVGAVAALVAGAVLGGWSAELTANPSQKLRDGTVVQSYSQVAGQQAYELAIGANVLFGIGAALGIGAATVWAVEAKGASSP